MDSRCLAPLLTKPTGPAFELWLMLRAADHDVPEYVGMGLESGLWRG